MSDATKLPAEQQAAAMASISAEGLPQAIERQAAAGESRHVCSMRSVQRCRQAETAAVGSTHTDVPWLNSLQDCCQRKRAATPGCWVDAPGCV
jgi:hypothetical protein